MNDDPLAKALRHLEHAQAALPQIPEALACPLNEALGALKSALDVLQEAESRRAQAESNLVMQQALLDDRLLRVENNRVFTLWNNLAAARRNFWARLGSAAERTPLGKLVPNHARLDEELSNGYKNWVGREQASLPSIARAREASNAWRRQPTFGILLVLRHGSGLAETLESIRNQAYRNWELCLVLDKTCESRCLSAVRDFKPEFGAVRHLVTDSLDSARALNTAAELTTAEYLAFIDEGGTLSPFALHYLAESLQSEEYDLLYTDEDLVDAEGRRTKPSFKPDWSPDLLTSCMYIGRLLAVHRAAFQQCGGLRSLYAAAPLHDLLLRMADSPIRVRHLTRVLYHASISAGAVIHEAAASSIRNDTARAIADAIARREGVPAECIPDPGGGAFAIHRKQPRGEMTAIICSRSPGLVENCLASLRATASQAVSRVIVVAHEESGPNPLLRKTIERTGATVVAFGGAFNFSAMNNLGAEFAKTPNLLFLNDDVEATCQGWAEMLGEQLSRQEIGVAGAVLWYPQHVLQHAGLVVGIGDGVGHIGRYTRSSKLWPWLLASRNVSGVTGACLAIRADLFRQLDGFDEAFPVNYNDVDLCFRVREHGLGVICVAVPGLIHRECQSRPGVVRFVERYAFHKRWAKFLRQPDPYYSPSLAPTEEIALNLNRPSLFESSRLGEL